MAHFKIITIFTLIFWILSCSKKSQTSMGEEDPLKFLSLSVSKISYSKNRTQFDLIIANSSSEDIEFRAEGIRIEAGLVSTVDIGETNFVMKDYTLPKIIPGGKEVLFKYSHPSNLATKKSVPITFHIGIMSWKKSTSNWNEREGGWILESI